MISIKSLVLSTLAAMSFAEVAQAQVGPLKDPIPAPIPQSPIQVELKPIRDRPAVPDRPDRGPREEQPEVHRGSDGTGAVVQG